MMGPQPAPTPVQRPAMRDGDHDAINDPFMTHNRPRPPPGPGPPRGPGPTGPVADATADPFMLNTPRAREERERSRSPVDVSVNPFLVPAASTPVGQQIMDAVLGPEEEQPVDTRKNPLLTPQLVDTKIDPLITHREDGGFSPRIDPFLVHSPMQGRRPVHTRDNPLLVPHLADTERDPFMSGKEDNKKWVVKNPVDTRMDPFLMRGKNKEPRKFKLPKPKIMVRVGGAQLLKEARRDVYCVCTIPGKSAKFETLPAISRLDPLWNASHEMPNWQPGDDLLFIIKEQAQCGPCGGVPAPAGGESIYAARLAFRRFYPRGFRGEIPLLRKGQSRHKPLDTHADPFDLGDKKAPLQPGDKVILERCEKMKRFNGKEATLVRFDKRKKVWDVLVPAGEGQRFQVNPDNLECEGLLALEKTAVLKDLVEDDHLNGREGKLVQYDKSRDTWVVDVPGRDERFEVSPVNIAGQPVIDTRLDPLDLHGKGSKDERFTVRPKNLAHLPGQGPPVPGDVVRLQNLHRNTRWNGHEAKLVHFNEETKRWDVSVKVRRDQRHEKQVDDVIDLELDPLMAHTDDEAFRRKAVLGLKIEIITDAKPYPVPNEGLLSYFKRTCFERCCGFGPTQLRDHCFDGARAGCKICCLESFICCVTGWTLCWGWCCGKYTIQELRHTCLRKFGLPDFGRGDSALANADYMCCCVPLRTAVFLNALCTIFNSLMYIFFHGLLKLDVGAVRIFTGGYALQSRVVISILMFTGVIWGAIGLIGALRLKSSFLRIYNIWQMARLAGWVCMYFTDVPLLWRCELWRTHLDEANGMYGWNPIMYDVAMSNLCDTERLLFTFFSTISLAFFAYLVHVNQRLIADLEQEPKYLLRLTDRPDGAFYAYNKFGKARPQVYGSVGFRQAPWDVLPPLPGEVPFGGVGGPMGPAGGPMGPVPLVGPAVGVPPPLPEPCKPMAHPMP